MVCSPNNFAYAEPLGEGMMRISALANYNRWAALGPEEYAQAKQDWYGRLADSAARFVPDFRPSVIETDVFTPRTIQRFTGHVGGVHLRLGPQTTRRHDPPEKPLYLRQRPRVGRHRRHDPQRHQHRQPASVEVMANGSISL